MNTCKSLKLTTIFLSLALFILHLIFTLKGVYFLGDTVSHFEFADIATNPLMAFIIHPREWPPFLALLLFAGKIIIKDLHILMLLSSSIALISAFSAIMIFGKKLSWSISQSILISSVLLLIPQNGVLLSSFISETFMMVFWIISSLLLFLFLTEKKEEWLILFILTSSLIPLSRYLGAVVLLWFCIIILFSLLLTLIKKKKTSYSRWLTLISVGLVWIPIAFFLFRTKVSIGSFFGTHDMQFNFNLMNLITKYLKIITKDMGLISTSLFLLGLTLPKKKAAITAFYITTGSVLIYLAFLLGVEKVYAVYDHLPARFLMVTYPNIGISAICFGILLKDTLFSKLKVFSKNSHYIKYLTQSIFILLLGFALVNQSKNYITEQANLESQVEGVLWSGDLRKICRDYQINAIVRHEASRNWGLRSFALVCKQDVRVIDFNSENSFVYAKEGIVSGYKINLSELKEEEVMNLDGYPFYVYTVSKNIELPLNKIFENRERFQ